MVTDPVLFRDLAYVFVVAVLAAVLARLARQPLILGYVVAGVLVSPLTPGPSVADIHTFELFAEIGVVLLMFSIGIEFSLRDLLRVKWIAIVGGPLGILLSVALGLGVGGLLGWPAIQGVVVGMVVSVASTMVLARLLLDRGELHTRHGRIMIGITLAVGLSLALGAFLAGLLISESDYAHETLARLLPIRDVFVALFFITVGALINPGAVFENPALLGVIVALVVAAKFVIWTGVVALFGQPLWTAVLVGVGLTQIGEFSFILISVARAAGHVGGDIYNAILAASLLTILGNALLVRWVPDWIRKARVGREQELPLGDADAKDLAGHVVVCGLGRVGTEVAEALEAFRVPYVAIDIDPDVVRNVRRRGVRCLFGDASNDHILEAASVDRAALVIVAVPEIERAYLAVRHVKARNPQVPILARAHDTAGRERLIAAGATEVIQPEVEAGATLIRHALRRLALPRDSVLAYLERFRVAMEDAPSGAAPGEALPQISDVFLGESPRLADQSLRDARIRERFAVTIVALTRANGDFVLHPAAETILRPGDSVRVFGRPAQIEAFRQEASGHA